MVTVATELLLSEVRLLCTWEREASEVSHVRVCGLCTRSWALLTGTSHSMQLVLISSFVNISVLS